MDRRISRRGVLALAGAGLSGTAGCLGSPGGGDAGDSGGDPADTTAWRTTELTDVRNGETFTLAELPRPVLLQTFAVWCSKCLRQQQQISALLQRDLAVTPVNLNVDPNENTDRVRDHLEDHGFDWRYAVAPPTVTDSLVDAFGSSITVPPQSPVVVVCGGEATRLSDGVKSADQLASAVEDCRS